MSLDLFREGDDDDTVNARGFFSLPPFRFPGRPSRSQWPLRCFACVCVSIPLEFVFPLFFASCRKKVPQMATPSKSGKKRAGGAKKSGGANKKAGLIFPIGRVGRLLRRGQYAPRVGAGAGVYLASVLEYLTAELLELSVKAVQQQKGGSKKKGGRRRISPRAVTLAVRHDADLGALLKDVTISRGGVVPSVNKALAKKKKGAKKSSATPSA